MKPIRMTAISAVAYGLLLALPTQASTPIGAALNAHSDSWVAAIAPRDAGHKVIDGVKIPFLLNGAPAFNFADLHVALESTLQGVMVKLRFATIPSFGYASQGATTPMQLSLKSRGRKLFTLAGINWDVICFHGSTFGAQILVPMDIYQQIDEIEVEPMKASLHACTSSAGHAPR